MKRFRRVIIVALLVVGWVTTERLLRWRTMPPPSVTNFSAFAKWKHTPRDIEVIQQSGADYLLATGTGGGVLPSGPSGYVFDRSGRLVDWSSDIGDDPRFRDKWLPSPQRRGPHFDVDGALKWINEGGTPSG
jgi:hypothetical protein